MKIDALKNLLLELAGTADRPLDPIVLARLTARDWQALVALAEPHLLGPLLHWRLARERSGSVLPPAVARRFARQFRGRTLLALKQQREMVRLQQALSGIGIEAVFLKGAYLAFHAYPHPGARPMRDLDLLIPATRADDAFERLIALGYRREDAEPLEADARHLPVLSSPDGVIVELHTALCSPSQLRHGRTDPSAVAGFHDRLRRFETAGVALAFPGPEELLLHLVIHAIYDHRLSNGPHLLADIAALLQTVMLDWELFWALAQQGGWESGCRLALAVMQDYYPAVAVTLPAGSRPPIDAAFRKRIARGMLRSFARRHLADRLATLGRAGPLSERLSRFYRLLFPGRDHLARVNLHLAGRDRNGRGRIVRWGRLLGHVWSLLRDADARRHPGEIRTLIELDRYLVRGSEAALGSDS